MAQAFLYGTGGSGGVNFKVVGGTTAPTNPKENTIWVKTDIDIGYWTTASSAKAPAYVAKKGTVTFWWESATSSEVSGTTAAGFMPVKYKATNPPGYMRLKPINCYQNQDGTASGWKPMEAYIYKSGSWVQFSAERLYLYKAGDECTAVTGGWTARGWVFVDNYAANKAPTITRTKSYMELSLSALGTGAVEPANDIDLTAWNTLTVLYSNCVSPSGERIVLEVTNRSNIYWGDPHEASVWLVEAGEQRSIDISEINGMWDIAICMGTWTTGNTQSVKIKEIYLE